MMLSQRLCFCCVCSIFAVYFLNNILSVKVLSNWQRFRDEQLLLLNWLSDEEKTLKDMGRTDLTNEEEVKQDLEKLRVRTWLGLKLFVSVLVLRQTITHLRIWTRFLIIRPRSCPSWSYLSHSMDKKSLFLHCIVSVCISHHSSNFFISLSILLLLLLLLSLLLLLLLN